MRRCVPPLGGTRIRLQTWSAVPAAGLYPEVVASANPKG